MKHQPVFQGLTSGGGTLLGILRQLGLLHYPNKTPTDSAVFRGIRLFLMVVEAGSLRLGDKRGGILGRALLWVADANFSSHFHMAESREGKQVLPWLLQRH